MMMDSFRSVDHALMTILQLSDKSDFDEKTIEAALEALKRIRSTTQSLQTLTQLSSRFNALVETKPQLKPLLQAIKQVVNPLSLYSNSEMSPSPSSLIGLGNVRALPARVAALYYDFFVGGEAPWHKVFDLVFSEIRNLPVPLLPQNQESTDLELKTQELMELINSPQSSLLKYPKFIDLLREIDSLPYVSEFPNHPCVIFLKKICYSHYADFKIYSFCEQLVKTMLNEGRKQLQGNLEGTDPFLQPLEDQFKCIHAAPQQLKAPIAYLFLNRLYGAVSVYFDPHRQTNIPWALYDFLLTQTDMTAKKVRVLRMGTPTYQRTTFADMTYMGNAKIDPVFRLFVEGTADLDQKILFLSLQDDFERAIGTENKRNDAQKTLPAQYPSCFFYAILSHDSSFYYQNGEYELRTDAGSFKSIFLEQLLTNNTGFYFPESWLADPEFQELLQTLLTNLHQILFDNRAELSHKERCSFIQIFYIFLALKLLVKTGADKLIFCCKDSIDRAGIENALMHYVLLILTDNEMSQDHLRAMHVYIHAATVIVKQQEMNHRYKRLLWALEILQEPQVRMRIKACKADFGVAGIDNFEINETRTDGHIGSS